MASDATRYIRETPMLIGADLRGEMKRQRLHPVKWGNPRGLTQQKLAALTGISEIHVRQVENGAKGVSANTAGLLCYTLGVPVRWLRLRKYEDIADIVAELLYAEKLQSKPS